MKENLLEIYKLIQTIYINKENHHANGMQLIIKEGDSSEQIRKMVKLDEINFCHKGFQLSSSHSDLSRFVLDIILIILLILMIIISIILISYLAIKFVINYRMRKDIL